MRPGERQVAPTLDGIRADHTARYYWAASMLGGGSVLDLACGVGYGSRILADAGCEVTAFDIDAEAIAYAEKHYSGGPVDFVLADLATTPLPVADAAVCFEMIEHLKDPRPLLKSIEAPVLLASVPNEEVFPWQNYAFHHRHYTKQQFEQLLSDCGWEVKGWYGQQGPESEVEENVNGRTLIAVAFRRAKKPPKHVVILGLGPSVNAFVDICKSLGGRHKFCDEVWGINALGNVIQCDTIFHMDDVRIQEIRAKERPESNIAAMLQWMKETSTPIITSRLHPDYPSLVEFPLEAVINDLTFDYFNSTAAYALAYAIHIGVEKVTLFGCDYTYPNAHDAEKGRGCLEFWLGYAAARGIKIGLPKTTSLMDAIYSRQDRLYGYDTREVIFNHDDNGRIQVEFKEITELPSAAEIEARYDHSKHPNSLVEEV